MATAAIVLSSLDGTNGFRLDGAITGDFSGGAVSSAGDVNGDGFDDLILGARYADPNGLSSGASYVVFGKSSGIAANFNLSTLDGTNGFRLEGVASGDRCGFSVSGAGDVNGDGFADLVVGAHGADPNGSFSGASYVVFGRASGIAASIDLSTLDGTNGFRLEGVAASDFAGIWVSDAGDVNGDGFDDVIVGAAFVDLSGTDSGASYVVFGRASGFAASVNLSTLDGTNGFRLEGAAAGDTSGRSASAAGDVNGDGFDDLIVDARYADPNGLSSGASYVVFGKTSGFAANVNLSTLDGTNGFRLVGVAALDRSGWSVSGAGDVNGDGFDDLIIGAYGADLNGSDSGASYVVFGRASSFAASVDLSTLDGTNGFRLAGVAAFDRLGWSASGAGDVNGDGFDDLIVGAWGADPNGSYSGASYVVFGRASGFAASVDLAALDATDGYQLAGEAADDRFGISVSGAGDVNGDGFDDFIVGAGEADTNGSNSGASYVVFGQSVIPGTDGDDTLTGSANDDTISGGAGNDTLDGGAGDDSLAGGTGNDMLDGGDGDDTLDGGAGADRMEGGAGNDTYHVDDAGDGVTEIPNEVSLASGSVGGGLPPIAEVAPDALEGFTDTVIAAIDYSLANVTYVENLTLNAQSTAAFATGNELDNVLTGNALANTLSGLAGNDTLEGGAGADTALYSGPGSAYTIGNGGTSVSGADGSDTLSGIERFQFSDKTLAFDLNAGQAASNTVRIIGAVFDAPAIAQHPNWVGTGLDLFDSGMSMPAVCELVVQIVGLSNTDFVTSVYTNVVGAAPSDSARDTYVGLLVGSGGSVTQAQLLELAANAGVNATNIDLVGLQQSGVDFV